MLFSVLVKIATFDVIPVEPIMGKLEELMPTMRDSSYEIPDNF